MTSPPKHSTRGGGQAPAELVIRNAHQVLTMTGPGVGLLQGGAVACRGGRVIAVCEHDRIEESVTVDGSTRVVDAGGGVVTPGLVEPHSHPVFAGERSVEFGMKAEGRTYLEIHKSGGGIFSTVRATRAASVEELTRVAERNLTRLLRWGVTTCEAKSGYALQLDGELRMLRALAAAARQHPVEVIPTLLGAHAIPPEYADARQDYVTLVAEEMIPAAVEQGLARFCDAYCEDGAFTSAEVERMFGAARDHGLGLRLHAEQFTHQGGAELAAHLGAASADHLEQVSPAGIAAMARAGTVAVLLPGAALACRCPWPPARELLDAGVEVALGTDLNPGSSMTSSLPLMMSLGAMQMGMSVEACWRGVTVAAARSLGLEQEIGRLAPGYRADAVVFDVPDYRYVPYHYGDNHATMVIKGGQVVFTRPGVSSTP